VAYQLVLQFPHASLADYDAMISLGDRIIEALGGFGGDLGDLDGHDAGSGEMNIFIITPEARATFALVAELSVMKPLMADLKAAYRDLGADDDHYVVLHPTGSTGFSLT
jgi:hypothetical protein